MSALWERQDFRRATGEAWRPGGLGLTRHALDWCARNALLAPGGLVVDFGCGVGASLELLASQGYRALGLDKNIESGLRGKESGTEAREVTPVMMSPELAVVQADISSPPLAAQCVDGILCECALSLLPDPLAALRAAYRALRFGGVLVVSDLTVREGHEGRDVPASTSYYGVSCIGGARSVSVWQELMEQAGFVPLHYEDNSRALVELAARILWYGDAADGALLSGGGSMACSCSGSGFRTRAYGYGLWISRKEAV